jgi:hypothetical protein
VKCNPCCYMVVSLKKPIRSQKENLKYAILWDIEKGYRAHSTKQWGRDVQIIERILRSAPDSVKHIRPLSALERGMDGVINSGTQLCVTCMTYGHCL